MKMMLRGVVWFVFAASLLRLTSSSNCSQNEFPNQEIDVNRSRQNGAQIDAYATFAFESFDECLEKCCGDENCTVVNFRITKKISNCIFYKCNPVEKCDLKNSTSGNQAGKVQRNDSITLTSTTTAVPLVPSTTTESKFSTSDVFNTTITTTSTTTLNQTVQFVDGEMENVTTANIIVKNETLNEDMDKESQPKKGVDQEPEEITNNLLKIAVNSSSNNNTHMMEEETENLNISATQNETTNELSTTVTASTMLTTTFLEKLINATIYDSDSKSESIPPREHLKESVHLIIALVIGLVLLIGVFGVLLRQLCDSWERRHYQRMDFLIDGMYNVNTT